MKKAILLLSSLFFFGQLFSQIVGDWERLGEVQAGVIHSPEIKKNGVIYSGEYRSFDGGINWEKHEEDAFQIGKDGTIIYHESKGTGASRFVELTFSKDNGETWQKKEITNFSSIFQIRSLTSGKWVALAYENSGSYLSLYFSEDEGDTWTFLYKNNWNSNTRGWFSEISDDVVYYPDGNFVANFNNNQIQSGAIFIPLHFVTSLSSFSNDIYGNIWVTSLGGIAKSEDGGFTWEKINFETTERITGTSFFAHKNGDLVASLQFDREPKQFLISKDGGNIWNQLSKDKHIIPWSQTLDDGTFFANADGLIRSTDNGETWQPSDFGATSTTISYLTWHGKDSIIAKSRDRLFRSIDGGTSWELIQANGLNQWYRLYKISDNGTKNQLVGSLNSLYLTDDFGNSFSDVTPPWFLIPNNPYNYYNCFTLPKGNLVVSGHFGYFLSEDQGKTWQSPIWTNSQDSLLFTDMRFGNNDFIFARGYSEAKGSSQSPELYRSSDQGKTWEQLPDAPSAYDFHFDNDGNIFSERWDSVLISENNGESFDFLNIKSPEDAERFQVDSEGNLIWLVCDTRNCYLLFSNKATEPFVKIALPIDSTQAHLPSIKSNYFFLSPDNYIHIYHDSGIFRFQYPTDQIAKLTSVSNNNFQKNAIKLFPNPTQNTFTISFPEKQKTNSNLLIFNNLSQKVFEQKLPKNQSEHQMDGLFLPEGVYFYLIGNEGAIIGNGKLVIKK